MDVNPTLTKAYIETNEDALRVIQGVLAGRLKAVSRRPYEIERAKLICSGNIFVFIEERSGIKRWTDGISWSPSRVVGKFLVYKELVKATAGSQSQPVAEGRQYGLTQGDASASGGASSSYSYRNDGLIKKALSLKIKRDGEDGYSTIHIISYYNQDEVSAGLLATPATLKSLVDVFPSDELAVALENTSIGNFKTYGHAGTGAAGSAPGPGRKRSSQSQSQSQSPTASVASSVSSGVVSGSSSTSTPVPVPASLKQTPSSSTLYPLPVQHLPTYPGYQHPHQPHQHQYLYQGQGYGQGQHLPPHQHHQLPVYPPSQPYPYTYRHSSNPYLNDMSFQDVTSPAFKSANANGNHLPPLSLNAGQQQQLSLAGLPLPSVPVRSLPRMANPAYPSAGAPAAPTTISAASLLSQYPTTPQSIHATKLAC